MLVEGLDLDISSRQREEEKWDMND
jgi:hypothetical protein